jgi:hypothetical protein
MRCPHLCFFPARRRDPERSSSSSPSSSSMPLLPLARPPLPVRAPCGAVRHYREFRSTSAIGQGAGTDHIITVRGISERCCATRMRCPHLCFFPARRRDPERSSSSSPSSSSMPLLPLARPPLPVRAPCGAVRHYREFRSTSAIGQGAGTDHIITVRATRSRHHSKERILERCCALQC